MNKIEYDKLNIYKGFEYSYNLTRMNKDGKEYTVFIYDTFSDNSEMYKIIIPKAEHTTVDFLIKKMLNKKIKKESETLTSIRNPRVYFDIKQSNDYKKRFIF